MVPDNDKPKLWVPPHYSASSEGSPPSDDAPRPAGGDPPPPAPAAGNSNEPAPAAPTGDAQPSEDELTQEAGNELEAQLAEQTERAATLEKDLLLLRAEFENFRKRLTRTTEERVRFAAQPLVADLLRVVDDLDRALAAAANSPDAPMREGVQMVRDNLVQVLANHGVEPIPAKDQPFDPNLHEAVHVVDTDDVPHETVLDVAAPGYTLHGRVVRAATVVVSRHSDPSTKIPVSSEETEAAAGDAAAADDGSDESAADDASDASAPTTEE